MAISYKLIIKDKPQTEQKPVEVVVEKDIFMTIFVDDKPAVEGIPVTDEKQADAICKEYMAEYAKDHKTIKQDAIDSIKAVAVSAVEEEKA